MGSDVFAVPTLESLARSHEHTLLAVVTQPDRPAGRKQRLTASPVKLSAEKLSPVPILQPEKARDTTFISKLRALAPDVIVVVAYGQILPKEILTLPPQGCINVHSSLLPRWRGASPVAHAILAGDTVTGVTTMRMDEGLDTGPILLQREEKIRPDDTTGSLEQRLAIIGAELLLETLSKLDSLKPRTQDNSQATHAPKLKKEDGRIDWTQSAEQIERRIRAFNPWPTTFTFHDDKRLQIWQATIVAAVCDRRELEKDGIGAHRAPLQCGQIEHVGEHGILVNTGQGSLLITELQRESGKRMATAEFLRGFRLEAGNRFT